MDSLADRLEALLKAIDNLPVEEWVEKGPHGEPELLGYVMQSQGEWEDVQNAADALRASEKLPGDVAELVEDLRELVTPATRDFYRKEQPGHVFTVDKAADIITAQAAEIARLTAERDRLREALKRCAQIVERYNWRQNEKVDDIPHIARAALGEASDE